MISLRVAGTWAETCDPVVVDNNPQVPGSDGFGLVVRFTIREGCEQEFDELGAATVEAIEAHEPGTVLYVTHAVKQEPGLRIFYELYRDRAAFDAHEAQPHTRTVLTSP